MKALIIEDERRDREVLKMLIEQNCPDVEIVATGDSIEQGLHLTPRVEPDITFMDVKLKDGYCFELLRKLRQANFELIIVTAFDNYALEAIKFSALDYLLKPVIVDELKSAVQKVKAKRSYEASTALKLQTLSDLLRNSNGKPAEFNKIALPSGDGLQLFEIATIIRVEAQNNCAAIHFKDKPPITVSKPLQNYEQLLSMHNFFRTHNAHLVNVNHITKYVNGLGGYVVLSDGSSVPVSARRKSLFLNMLNKV